MTGDVESGRRLVVVVLGLIFCASMVSNGSLVLASDDVPELIKPIVRFGLTSVLLYRVYKGSVVARYLTAISFAIGLVLLVKGAIDIGMIPELSNILVIITLSYAALFVAFVYATFISPAGRAFLAGEQKEVVAATFD